MTYSQLMDVYTTRRRTMAKDGARIDQKWASKKRYHDMLWALSDLVNAQKGYYAPDTGGIDTAVGGGSSAAPAAEPAANVGTVDVPDVT